MSLLALHHHPDEGDIRRYGAASVAIVLLHVAVIGAALLWYQRAEPEGLSIPAIFIDLPPAPAAPQLQTEDLPPGPIVQEAEAPPPEPPKREVVEEQLPPTPPQSEPVVAAPPKVEPKPEPTPVKPQPVREPKPIKKRHVEHSTAARADRIAPDAPAPTAGASARAAAAAAASYRAILAAHLQRFKQYPGNANGAQGRPSVSITVARDGRVTSSRLAQPSGVAALDQAALALIQRAQPVPAFPAEMRESSMAYVVPFNYLPPTR